MIRASKSHQHGDIAASTIAISMLYKNRGKGCRAGHKHKSKKEEAYPISVTSSFIVVTPLGFKPKTFRTGI